MPTVGADQMRLRRTMSWLRIDRFVEPAEDGVTATGATGATGADTRFLPMLCQHCDHAPCETVCPTYATYHTAEGLNAQVYNRCVGTRYCSNNCPYTVRRFNWFEAEFPAPTHLQLNPDVTVRSTGVMEKCTFCVQRIAGGRERARDEDRPMQDGDVTPACAQTCPAQAIVFGDLNDPESRVSQLSADIRGYHVLAHTNTRPAVTYLRKVLRVNGTGAVAGTAGGMTGTAAAAGVGYARIDADILRDDAPPRPGLLRRACPGARGPLLRRVRLLAAVASWPGRRRLPAPHLLGRLHHELRFLGRHRALGHADFGGAVPLPSPVAGPP